MTVGVVAKIKQESVYGMLSVGTKKGHGREVALSRGSIVVLVKYVEKNLNITKPRTLKYRWSLGITKDQVSGKICSP